MDTHIDWLSFTLPTSALPEMAADVYLIAKHLLSQISKEHVDYVFDGQGFEPAIGRAPFRYCLERGDRGVRIFAGGHVEYVLIEVTGRACEGLREFKSACGFLTPIADNITRIDVAVDIRCEIRPSEFTNKRDGKSFRSVSYIKSDDGETVYIGSSKSDRFCRVYRYNQPHPRADTLRVEYVFRRGLATGTARFLLNSKGWQGFAAAAGNTYGWTHPIYDPKEASSEKLTVDLTSKSADKTTFWLYRQVAPALARMVTEEGFNIADWLEEVYKLIRF